MLRVIAAGLPRTGTFSLKRALEQLGYGPSYHMVDVFARPDHVNAWRGALQAVALQPSPNKPAGGSARGGRGRGKRKGS
jgi:Sulfotransferase domain